jgi:glutaminyl-peptide cyclotransferase
VNGATEKLFTAGTPGRRENRGPAGFLRVAMAVLALAGVGCGSSSTEAGGIKDYGYEVVHTYPHDPHAFTEGLFYLNGFLYEATGLEAQSSVRKVRLETGEVVQQHNLPEAYFGEGIVAWKDRLLQLTYTTQVGFVYDLSTFGLKSQFSYPGQGWSMTTDGKRIIMDDGTPEIRFWNPETLRETGRIRVTADGEPVSNLNELEWVKGEIFANVWHTDRIARIDPVSGAVRGWIDLNGLLDPADRLPGNEGAEQVLNGIAYDAKGDRLFVTGKYWPKLFEIRLVNRSGAR